MLATTLHPSKLVLALLFAGSLPANAESLPCFETSVSWNRPAFCRADAGVLEVRGRYFVWGGHDGRQCSDCSYEVRGLDSGAFYELDGRLNQAVSRAGGPGPRVSPQILFNGAAIYVWGGFAKYVQRYVRSDGEHVASDFISATANALYLPGSDLWIRISTEHGPPLRDSVEILDSGSTKAVSASRLEPAAQGRMQACWTETMSTDDGQSSASFCKVYFMQSNSWGDTLER